MPSAEMAGAEPHCSAISPRIDRSEAFRMNSVPGRRFCSVSATTMSPTARTERTDAPRCWEASSDPEAAVRSQTRMVRSSLMVTSRLSSDEKARYREGAALPTSCSMVRPEDASTILTTPSLPPAATCEPSLLHRIDRTAASCVMKRCSVSVSRSRRLTHPSSPAMASICPSRLTSDWYEAVGNSSISPGSPKPDSSIGIR